MKEMIEKHHLYTDSAVAKSILEDWDRESAKFIQVMPRDYKRGARRVKGRSDGHSGRRRVAPTCTVTVRGTV